MTLSRLRARFGGLLALGALALFGCGKPPEPEPTPRAVEPKEEEKKDKPKPKEEVKKPPTPVLSGLDTVVDVGWKAPADPADPIRGPFNLRDTIPFEGEVVVPRTHGPFVAVAVPRAKAPGTYRVYDVRTMDALGERVVLPPRARARALSPEGTYLAARLTGKDADVIEVYSTMTGKRVFRRDFAADKLTPGDVELLSGGRLWVAQPGVKGQMWDIKETRQLPALDRVPPPTDQRAFSPGGRYLLTAQRDGPSLAIYDLQSGKRVGERRFQVPVELKGAPVALNWSRDGKEIALLWRLDQPTETVWGRLVCWELESGKKLFEHPVEPFENIDALLQTGKSVVQFWPNDRGWMLFGFLFVDRESGFVIHRLGLPRDANDLQDRRFLDSKHVTDARRLLRHPLKVIRVEPRGEAGMKIKRKP